MSAVASATYASASSLASPLAMGEDVRPLAFDCRGETDLSTFRREVLGVAASLPPGRYAINLCEDRYRFLVGFCAAIIRGQTTLLPSCRAPGVVDQVLAAHPGSYCLGDAPLAPQPPHYHCLPAALPRAEGVLPDVPDDALVAIGFTSGSTGEPKANPKRWGDLRTSTGQNLAALGDLLPRQGGHLVATVPPQHMYGMEMTVLLPLLGPVAVHAGRPFFPGDVAQALAQSPEPALLVTTPVHLRALVASGVDLPPMAGIVSATAPLAVELAAAAEARFGCEVREVFGSTETCIFARRRTAIESAWTLLPGVRLSPQPDGTAVHAAHLDAPVVVADLMDLLPDGRFELRGRSTDLLEIAGKRASLGDLTRKLLAVPGVEDGVVLQMDGCDSTGVRRIAALAVAPGISEGEILEALRAQLDPVFLPRRLRRVERLPRNETGKLPRQVLLDLLA